MMTFTDPAYPVQVAIIAALKASPQVSGIVGVKVFDRVKADTAAPFLNVSEVAVDPELAEGTDAANVSFNVHGWSEKVGFAEIYKLGAAVAAALHESTLTVSGNTVQSVLLESSRYLRDPDGITSHGIFSFSLLTDAS